MQVQKSREKAQRVGVIEEEESKNKGERDGFYLVIIQFEEISVHPMFDNQCFKPKVDLG